jgi:hypothetical protein
MTRAQVLLVAGALAVCLIAGSPPRLVGDGREYLAQATSFASFHGPAFRPADIPHIQSQIARFDPDLAGWDIWGATVADSSRGRVFLHFWFYALLATPGLWLTNLVGAPPTFAFAALNLALLGMALWLTLPRIGPAASLLLFAGPTLWWIDKAHTEIFTFALLTIAFALMRDRPWWSMIAAGAAATQNPPIAALVGLVFTAIVIRRRSALTDRRVLAGAAGGLALAVLHPIYSYTHHGTASLLLMQTRSDRPTLQTISAVVFDPTLGLIGNFPLFLVVVAAAVLVLARRDRRQLLSAGNVVAAITAGIFLLSFSRTTNMHHGGTPGLSRYAVWLIPLAVPLLSIMEERSALGSWRPFLWTTASVSALISVFAFHPSVPQNSREPTWLATLLWTRFPAVNNPLPEVFIETELHVDEPRVPVATAGCEKVLVAGRDGDDGVWPIPCYPEPLPEECRVTGAMCYANLVRDRYEFSAVPAGRAVAGILRPAAVWPAEAVPHVRKLYEAWNWRSLRVGSSRDVVRAAVEVSVVTLGSERQFIMVLSGAGPGAVVRLRPPGPMSGVLVDARTGRTLSAEHYDGSDDLWSVDIPRGFDVLLLAMRADAYRSAPSPTGL